MTDEELVQTLIGEVLTQYEADSILKSIGNLKSENDELKSRLTHATEECLKWHERAQNLLKDSGGSISGYEKKISDLQSENAALRERLDKAVELPCIERMTTYEWNDESGVGAPIQSWQVLYRDETGEFFAEPALSEEAAEARLKELKGEKQ